MIFSLLNRLLFAIYILVLLATEQKLFRSRHKREIRLLPGTKTSENSRYQFHPIKIRQLRPDTD